jgi:hypothetical protein
MFDHELMGRFCGLAVVDIVGTIVIAALLAFGVGKYYGLCGDKLNTFVVLGIAMAFILGEMVHIVMRIKTRVV